MKIHDLNCQISYSITIANVKQNYYEKMEGHKYGK
jgi:hypothetical protein